MTVSKRDFDKEAATWDAPPRVKLAADVSKAILEHIRLSPDMDVLDFGCGTGLVSLPFSHMARSITGVDSSKGMLDVFDYKVQGAGARNVKTLHMDLAKGDTVPGRFHLIVSSMTLHHVKDTKALLEQFYGLLHPGGYVAIVDLDEEGGLFHDNNDGIYHFGFGREKLCRLFEEAGFCGVISADAAQITKKDSKCNERTFGIFLIKGRKIP